jgi:hypothetical protein
MATHLTTDGASIIATSEPLRAAILRRRRVLALQLRP